MITLSKKIRYLISTLAVISLVVLVIQVQKIINADRESEKHAFAEITSKGESIVKDLDQQFAKLKNISQSMADDIISGRLKNEKLHEAIKNILEKKPDIYGLGVAFEPGFNGPGTNLYAPYYIRGENGLECRPIEKSYNYTSNSKIAEWYLNTKKNNTPGWQEPIFGKASGTHIQLYTIPLFTSSGDNKKKFIGVVVINFSLAYIKKVMDSFGLEQTGCGYIISQKGKFLVHPNKEIVNQEKLLSQLAKETGRDDLKQLWKKIRISKNEAETFKAKSILTAEPAILYLKTVPALSWSFVADFVQDEIEIDHTFQNQCKIRAIINGCFLLTCLCALLIRVDNRTSRALWLLSIAFSLILCTGIIAVWTCEETGDITNGGIKMTDRTTLKKYLNKHGGKSLIQIPTGVFIQSLEFRSGNDVFVTGYIWQKYSKDLPTDISRGFVLCEGIEPRIEKIYELDYPKETTIGWHFESLLRQQFDYRWYPMDNKDVWIRMEHADFNKPTILVPDFDSYKMIYPGFLPGIEKAMVMPGLTFKRSFFSYVLQSYDTNFGIRQDEGENTGSSSSYQEGFPELYFTVIVKRKFLDPFIRFLLPAVVVALIIFSLLMIATYREDKSKKLAYTSSFTLGASAGLFFSTMVAHSQLRNAINVDYLIYLDYYYIILYPLILLLVFNSFIVSSNIPVKFFQFRDNMLPKLLFWPVVILFFFVLTVMTIY